MNLIGDNIIFGLLNYSLQAKFIVMKIQMKAYQSINLTRALNLNGAGKYYIVLYKVRLQYIVHV